jgi:hypothetical protein
MFCVPQSRLPYPPPPLPHPHTHTHPTPHVHPVTPNHPAATLRHPALRTLAHPLQEAEHGLAVTRELERTHARGQQAALRAELLAQMDQRHSPPPGARGHGGGRAAAVGWTPPQRHSPLPSHYAPSQAGGGGGGGGGRRYTSDGEEDDIGGWSVGEGGASVDCSIAGGARGAYGGGGGRGHEGLTMSLQQLAKAGMSLTQLRLQSSAGCSATEASV